MDSDEKSIRCARENLKNYGLSNAEFITGKAGRILKNMASEKTGRINAVILDPPRTGCEKDALDGIVKVKPERIVYVACNPATQARDIRYLCDHGFLLTELQPVDMFPQTAHIEVVALLKTP
jgi:tRNA/tmRNA/rRNA uracil-C5-methylase (TrmA/RlmC/RlmD family)